jgi:serine/threonine protein kinase
MWSVGIIATTLLTGDVIFTNRVDPNYENDPKKVILSMASKCDLSVLDSPYSPWRLVGKRPKDFIRKVLVLEELQRLTVQQALVHEWFTNRHHVDEFEAVYQRAIHDWEPRRKIFRIVEALDLSRLQKQSTQAIRHDMCYDSRTSHHFVKPSSSDRRPNPKPYSNTLGKRVHTPLPKINEEIMADLNSLSMPYSDVHTSIVENISDVENSMSQLALAVLSQESSSSIPDSHLTASEVKPLEVNTEIFTTDLNDSQFTYVHEYGRPHRTALQASSYVAGPPFSPSFVGSDCEVVAETPPSNTPFRDRKRRSPHTSEDLYPTGKNMANFDDFACGGPVKEHGTKRMRVA